MSRDLARHTIRLQTMVRVGKLTLPPNETGTVQKMQVQLNTFETLDNIHSIQLFGIASSPPVSSDAVVLGLAGDNSNCQVIATNNNLLRPINMAVGETQIYDAAGQKVYLSQSGGRLSIVIAAGQDVNITSSANINLTAPLITLTGNLVVNGTINATGDISSGTITLDTHHHVQSGGGNTGTAIG